MEIIPKSVKNKEYAEEIVKDFYAIKNIDSLGLTSESEEIVSIAMTIMYIKETQLMDPKHIEKPVHVSLNSTMILDRATIRNLEIINNAYTGSIENSLFYILNKCKTRMGTRLLYSWLLNPLINKNEIEKRLSNVKKFISNPEILEKVCNLLEEINDIERITGRIGLRKATPRDMKALQFSLESSLEIIETMEKEFNESFSDIDKEKISLLAQKIDSTISEMPPTLLTDGGIIKDGFSKEVDELRAVSHDSKNWLKVFEEDERSKTEISSLKVGFNSVFGYYIEVRKTNQDKVPDRYIRKQTLANSERYITEELKEKEDIILHSHERLVALEYDLYDTFRDSFLASISSLQKLAYIIAEVDVISNFAYISNQNEYVCPEIYDLGENDGIIDIEKGRHPIIESISDEEFISNNTSLSMKNGSMAILTGPNMSGKSTYIRQVATIVLMAQIGCYVPASKAIISIADRIFTRVGASDDLVKGRSTFMVEMDESANIVNSATKYSLIILDEVGRGTSTYDGVSIAWALTEYLIKDVKARTLFATHYHELLKLSELYPSEVKNYNVLVEENVEKGEVIFLRKIVEGGTDRSYGIYVAKMAGLPEKIIKRANEILESFEQKNMFSSKSAVREIVLPSKDTSDTQINMNAFQYPLFAAKESEIEREIQNIDIDNLTPIDALNRIVQWKKRI